MSATEVLRPRVSTAIPASAFFTEKNSMYAGTSFIASTAAKMSTTAPKISPIKVIPCCLLRIAGLLSERAFIGKSRSVRALRG